MFLIFSAKNKITLYNRKTLINIIFNPFKTLTNKFNNMYPLPNFRSLKSLAKHLAKNPQDNFVFDGLWFTQDYYDQQGKVMTYGNKSNKLTIECVTENRYISRKDMTCSLEEMTYDLPITYIN